VNQNLNLFEHGHAREFLLRSEDSAIQTLENRVKGTNVRVEAIERQIAKNTQLLTSINPQYSPPCVYKDRFSYIEEQMKDITKTLALILASMSHKSGNGKPQTAPKDKNEQRLLVA
jgi:hypothetical protein